MERENKYHLHNDRQLPQNVLITNAGKLFLSCLDRLENNQDFQNSLIKKYPSKEKIEPYGGFIQFNHNEDIWTIRVKKFPRSYSLEITREDQEYPKYSDHLTLDLYYNGHLSEKNMTQVEKASIFYASVLENNNTFKSEAWENNKQAIAHINEMLKKL